MITAHYENQLMSSLLLTIDHHYLKKERHLRIVLLLFLTFLINIIIFIHFAALTQPITADKSISNATIMTGIFLKCSLLFTGTSGFYDINFSRNQLYFNQPVTGTITGQFALKDYHIELTNEPEETLLFETKYNLRSKVSKSLSGIAPDEITYPIIYLRNNGGSNIPFQFGGTDLTQTNVRVIVITDSQFSLDATLGYLKDLYNTPIPLIPANEFPFNAFGGLRSGVYNYDQLTSGHLANNNYAWVDRSFAAPYNQTVKVDVQTLNPDVFAGFVELNISKPRDYRS